MQLHEILRVQPGSGIAVVGSGGKTSVCIRLAESFGKNVVITTTTHVGVHQFDRCAEHFIVHTKQEVDDALCGVSSGRILLTCESSDDIRYRAPAPEIMAYLAEIWQKQRFTLIVEADGARSLPLKAPGEHEPAIPEWVETVIVTAGCSGIGMPLIDSVVHRMDVYQELSGLAAGEIITPDAAVQVLTDPRGGLKNIPPKAGRILILNQADDDLHQAQAGRMAAYAIDHGYDRAVVASLDYEDELPQVFARYEPVAGILLAAGGSFRMGQTKQLLEMDGQPLVRRVAARAVESGFSPLIVVVGAARDVVVTALEGLPVKIVVNPDWDNGQSTSVLAGLKALPLKTGAVEYILADQPYVDASLMLALANRWRISFASIVAPLIAGQRANPVLFDRSTFPEFASLTGDQGAKSLLRKFKVDYLPWHDVRALLDIDTMDDYVKSKKV